MIRVAFETTRVKMNTSKINDIGQLKFYLEKKIKLNPISHTTHKNKLQIDWGHK